MACARLHVRYRATDHTIPLSHEIRRFTKLSSVSQSFCCPTLENQWHFPIWWYTVLTRAYFRMQPGQIKVCRIQRCSSEKITYGRSAYSDHTLWSATLPQNSRAQGAAAAHDLAWASECWIRGLHYSSRALGQLGKALKEAVPSPDAAAWGPCCSASLPLKSLSTEKRL